MPIYFSLRNQGYNVYLWNFSFTLPYILEETCDQVYDDCYIVNADPYEGEDAYFPEKYLCQWLKSEENIDGEIYVMPTSCGVKPVTNGFRAVIAKLNIDTIIAVDGGTDSLMRGDETQLGTPVEDLISIRSIYDVENVKNKILMCIGFGIDHFHGVCHSLVLENIAHQIQEGGYLGCFSMMKEMPEYQKSKNLAQFSFDKMQISIVTSSINNSVDGHFGDYHSTSRTRGSELFINPLMSIYWCFKIETVGKNCLYFEMLKDTETSNDVIGQINKFRSTIKNNIRSYVTYPH